MGEDDLESFRLEWKNDLEKGIRRDPVHDTTLAQSRLERIEASSVRQVEHNVHVLPSADSSTTSSLDIALATKDSTYLNATKLLQVKQTPSSISLPSGARESSIIPNAEPVLSAFAAYELGVEKERQGLLSDALIFYRKAFKMDPKVDTQYRDAFRAGKVRESTYENIGTSVEETNYAKFVQTGHDYDPSKSHESTTELVEMTAMMAALRIPVKTTVSKAVSADISSLPEEILYQVLTHAIVSDSALCFTALSMTCQKFFLLLHDQSIWRTLCSATYSDQVYTGEGVKVASASAWADYAQRLAQEVEQQYLGNWKRTFIEKPRIRFNGIYISTCHYTRPGVREESLDWTSPIHLVTYFRFLRFYSDGTCLSLLTPAQPKDVVHSIVQKTKLKGIQRGQWSMTRAGEVSIEANGPSDYRFFMELQIKSSSRGRQNKLAWSRFFGVHPLSAEVTQFNLKNDKSHYFYKVKSYSSPSR